MGSTDNEELNFDAEATVPKKKIVKRVAKPKSSDVASKPRKPKTEPPPVDDDADAMAVEDGGEVEGDSTPVRKPRASKSGKTKASKSSAAAASTSTPSTRGKKRVKEPVPEELEPAPAGAKKPVRREQSVTSAFNRLQNKRGDVMLKPDDPEYFSLDDLKQEYADKGIPDEYEKDPRYVEAFNVFSKINGEWNLECAKWREENKELADWKDRVRAAKRRRTAHEKQEAQRLKNERHEQMELTIKAIGTGLVPVATNQVSVNKPIVSGHAVPLSLHTVIDSMFKYRSDVQRAIEEGSSTFLTNIIPNFEVEYKGSIKAPKKKVVPKPVIMDVEEDVEEDGEEEEVD